MNMSKRVKGSISLLLCLVMLPFVTYSTMIIDASRLQAVRTNIASAGEDVMNALMSEYEYLLEDMYGLFANCKSEEELRPALKAYFQQTIEGRLLPESGKTDYTQDGLNAVVDMIFDSNGDIDENDLTDFLKLQLQAAESDFMAAPVDGSALASPYIMKRQITEYMKYRGPISIASTLLGKIDYLSNAESQVEACDQKVKYAEELGKMQGPCLEAYEAFDKKYNMGALTMNALLNNSPARENNSVAPTNSLNGFGSDSSATGMEKIIGDCRGWYFLATRFYTMNANSPFTVGSFASSTENPYNYDRVSSDLNCPTYDYSGDLIGIENCSPADKIKIYSAILNDLITNARNHCGFSDTIGTPTHDNQDPQASCTFSTPGNDVRISINPSGGAWYRCFKIFNGYDSSDATYDASSCRNTNVPSYQDINGSETDYASASWLKPYYDGKCDENADYTRQNSYAENVFEAQRNLYSCEGDIRSMIRIRRELASINAAYQGYWHELTEAVGQYFEDQSMTFNGSEETQTARQWMDEIENDNTTYPETSDKDWAKINLWNEYADSNFSSFYFTDSSGIGHSINLNQYEATSCYFSKANNALAEYEGKLRNLYATAQSANDCYVKFGDASCDRGSYPILAIGMILTIMKNGLGTGINHLKTIKDMISGPNGLESKAQSWKGSIDVIDSDSTRAAMLSDYQTTVDKFSEEEVSALIELATELQTQVNDEITLIKSIKYFDNSIFDEGRKGDKQSLRDMIKNYVSAVDTPVVDTSADPQKHANTVLLGSFPGNHEYAIPPRVGSTVSNFQFRANNDLNEHTKEIMNAHFSPGRNADLSNYVSGMKYFRILDGVNDENPSAASASIYAPGTANGSYSLEENRDLLDPKESFMITLYTEWKAAQQAQENADANTEENQTLDQLETEAASTTAPLDTDCTTTSMSLTTADIAGIASAISSYCDMPEGSLPVASVSTNVSIARGKDAGQSSGGGALESCKNLLAELGHLMEKVVENVYMEEYFTEMFTCRTDNQRLNPLTAPENHKVLPVIMLNGYGNSNSGASKLLNENTEWYGKEIEYILWGNSDLDTNLTYTDGMIFAIRFALNAIYAFTAQDIQLFARNLATAIAGWTVVGVPIVAACITLLIALAESAYDIVLLHDGQDVPIYKTKDTFMCSPTGIAARLGTKLATEAINSAIASVANKVEEELDSAVNEISEEIKTNADLKLSDCLDKFDTALSKYETQAEDALKTAIKNQFITPIMNELTPLGSILEITEHYQSADPEELVDGALDKAMRAIVTSVHSMGDGHVKDLCMTLLGMSSSDQIDDILNNSTIEGIKNQLKPSITSYLQSLSSTTAIPTLDIDKVIDKKMDEVIKPVADAIKDKAKDAKDKISQKISGAVDTAASAAKSEIHNWMDEQTALLTGKTEEVLNESTNQLEKQLNKSTVDKDVSSRVATLNYKEYCKIFMLLFVTFNQDKMLQRAGVMMTANMQTALSKPQPDFDLTKANTMFSVNAQMKMATLFPWPVKDVMNETSPDTGIQLDLSNIRGSVMTVDYCAVNGY